MLWAGLVCSGSVRFAYHKFGPLGDAATAGALSAPSGLSMVFKSKLSPVVFISGWGLSMYMWPVPVSAFCGQQYWQQRVLGGRCAGVPRGEALSRPFKQSCNCFALATCYSLLIVILVPCTPTHSHTLMHTHTPTLTPHSCSRPWQPTAPLSFSTPSARAAAQTAAGPS